MRPPPAGHTLSTKGAGALKEHATSAAAGVSKQPPSTKTGAKE